LKAFERKPTPPPLPPGIPRTLAIGSEVLARHLGLPEMARITSAWVDLSGTVTVAYEEPAKTPPPLRNFYLEKKT
jgi:hypothetical protein